MAPLDYAVIASRLLSSAETLLSQWLPGGRVRGKYYECGNIQGGPGDSFKVSLETGLWGDFAADQKGKDLIDLYGALCALSNHDAAIKLSTEYLGGNGIAPPAENVQARAIQAQENAPTIAPEPVHIVKPPLDAPKPPFGSPSKTWCYRNEQGEPLFHIARYDRSGKGKAIIPYSWDGTTWIKKHYPAPRPLYGLELLSKAPTNAVLLVEGEKACEAARVLMGSIYVVMTWPGGSQATDKIDWKPLAGRRILMWPDADEPGTKAMLNIAHRIAPHTSEIKILDPLKGKNAKGDGWDAADALIDKWTKDDVIVWAKERLTILSTKGSPLPAPTSAPMTEHLPKDSQDKPQTVENITDQIKVTSSLAARWMETGLAVSGNGIPIYNEENVLRIFEKDTTFNDFIWFDDFHKKYFTQWSDMGIRNGHIREWSDRVDNIRLTTYLQRRWGLSKISTTQVCNAWIQYAHAHPKNEPRDWLLKLKWDGKSRVEECLTEAFNAQANELTYAISKNFFVSMAARIIAPGCQADSMMILEGKQGQFKTSSLRILGGKWYAQVRHQIGTPNFFNSIQGKWLVEIAEFEDFNKAQVAAIKEMLATPVDRYRPPYAVTTQDFPRTCIFCGTTNEHWIFNDPTGARRFWPVKVSKIRLEYLRDNREQLFAEAYQRFISKEKWYEVDEKKHAEETEDRRQIDPWEDKILEYINRYKDQGIFIADIMGDDCLKIPIERQEMKTQKRVGRILRHFQWRNKPVRGADGRLRKMWLYEPEDADNLKAETEAFSTLSADAGVIEPPGEQVIF